ncbi:MAG: hypothetical protein HDT20_02375 [Oscillibacter sp.]|nr:hypothetical protein [Oscillibacter sp.]
MRKDYMTQLSRWARWMLPWQEASDVIADYHDIIAIPPRSRKELIRDLGKPRDVVKALAQPKQYYVWLAVFSIMLVCILMQVNSSLISPVFLWCALRDGLFRHWREQIFYCYILFVPGIIAALVWFRRQGRKAKHIPKAVSILLAVLLVYTGGVLLFYWSCFWNLDAFLGTWEGVPAWVRPEAGPLYLSQLAMSYSCSLFALTGVYSLIKARTGDRRWAAVYVLAMAAILISRTILEWSQIPVITSPEESFRQLMLRCTIAAAVGMAGTGVALC